MRFMLQSMHIVAIIVFNMVALSCLDATENAQKPLKLSKLSESLHDEYDFVIVGSGSGGSVMANRLSEVTGWTVLLLEAGGEEIHMLTDVPLSAAALTLTGQNWGYKTEREKNACLGLAGGVCNWPKGRVLGGTSVINYLLYNRGHQDDFNEWAAMGNTGWRFDDVLPYFRKSERITVSEQLPLSSHRGTDGHLYVQNPPYKSALLTAFLQTGRRMGYNINDPNGAEMLGFSAVQATMRNGRRCSASAAYLTPTVRVRKNLHILPHSWATRILIDAQTKIAYGVEFVTKRQRYRVQARREVILAAGAIGSPQLLMLSGIGPAKHIGDELQIPVIQDLPVGYNLQDHTGLSGLIFLVNESITITERSVQNPRDIIDYFLYGRGPFTSPGGAEGVAFVKLPNSTLPTNYPDIEIVMGGGALSGDSSGTMRNMLGITDEFFRTVYKGVIGHHAFGMVPIVMKPKSRGRISLKSRNPFQWPRMVANYFDVDDDLNALVEGAKMAVEMGESHYFRKYGARFHRTPFLGCEHLVFGSDDYWKCCITRHTSSLQHQVGTCKMGLKNDLTAVVDAQLRVHGIQHLRVVDASIMPVLPSAHTNAVVFMIGEMAADFVKTEWINSTQTDAPIQAS